MKKSSAKDILLESGRFEYVRTVGNLTCVLGGICDLTPFASINIKSKSGAYIVGYDLCITTLRNKSKSIDEVIQNISRLKYVGLPRVFDLDHFNYRLIDRDTISDWILNDISDYINKYCLDKFSAISAIESGNDPIFCKFKRVYGSRFDDILMSGLK